MKKIEAYNKGKIQILATGNTRQEAWTKTTDVGATIIRSHRSSDGIYYCIAEITGDLIKIEQLEREGWTW